MRTAAVDLDGSTRSSLVHHPCVGDLGWIADAPKAPLGYRPARSTAVMSTMSSAESGGSPGRADRRQD
ncbi:hypothetical protein BIS44_2905 [Mycobacterium tuberculosis variant bovis BCG]|nr:hypothetical protein BIS44_2905 [Mycobacterium tuberculosis variant bovis BCG]